MASPLCKGQPTPNNPPPIAVQVRGGTLNLTPKLKSETTRLCVALLTIKRELAGSGAHIPYGDGGRQVRNRAQQQWLCCGCAVTVAVLPA